MLIGILADIHEEVDLLRRALDEFRRCSVDLVVVAYKTTRATESRTRIGVSVWSLAGCGCFQRMNSSVTTAVNQSNLVSRRVRPAASLSIPQMTLTKIEVTTMPGRSLRNRMGRTASSHMEFPATAWQRFEPSRNHSLGSS